MDRQTNRHRRLLLLAAPLVASAVGLTPAFAAQARPAGPGTVPAAAACQLVVGASGGPGGDARYKLRLTGFPAKQAVRVDGPKTTFRATVNGKGQLDRQGVRHGAYTVTYKAGGSGKDVRVTCAAAPAGKTGDGRQTVKVTKVEVVVLTPPGTVIDCAEPTTAEFDGKVTATGPGKVRFHWTSGTSSKPVSPGSADFPAGTTTEALLHVTEVPAQPNAATVSVYVTLHLPDQKMTARSGPVTFTCKK